MDQDELLDESSMNSSGVEEFLASQGISSSPIRGDTGDAAAGEEELLNSPQNTTADVGDIVDIVGDDAAIEEVGDGGGDDDDEIEFNLEAKKGGKGDGELVDPPSTVKKVPRPKTPATISSVNKILKDYGFDSIGSETEINDKFVEILDVVKARGETITNMSQSINMSMDTSLNASAVTANLTNKQESLKRKNALLTNENDKLRKQVDTLKKKAATELRKLKVTRDGLQSKLQQAAHTIKAKETIIERLTDKLNLEADKERRSLSHSQEVFKTLHSRSARKGSPSDSKALEVIGMYEAHKDRMDDEMMQLRGEVKALNDALKDKENGVVKKELEGYAGVVDETMERMTERFREQEKENRLLVSKEQSFAKKLSKLEDKLNDTKEQLKSAQDESTNLLLELQSRPTVKQYKASERRIDELERKLYAAVEAAQESADVRALKKHMGTKALIEEDKANHRLRLERLDAIPREISKEILKQTCRELDISDVTLIAPCIRKMSSAMLLLPRLERFINEVCGFVFKHTEEAASKQTKKRGKSRPPRKTMEDVMPILRTWESQLSGYGKSQEFKTIIIGELCRRSVVPADNKKKGGLFGGMSSMPGATPEMSEEQALRAVRDLVELEKAVMAREDLYENAEAVVQNNPDLFVNRVVLHFRYLFGIKSMEGVFPKMNEIYLFTTEMNAFVRELRGIFGMSRNLPTASVVKMMLEIASELEKSKQLDAFGVPGRAGVEEDEEEEELENYVVGA